MQLLTITLILWPYLFFAGCGAVFSLDGNGGTLLLLFAILYTILSGILHRLHLRYAKTSGLPLAKIAKYNLLLKLIPAVCDTLLYGSITISYIKTMIDIANGAMMCVPVHLILFVLLIPYNLSRLFSLFTTMRISRYLLEEFYWNTQKNMLHSRVWLHAILHFLPVCHVISNIIVYRKLKAYDNREEDVLARLHRQSLLS